MERADRIIDLGPGAGIHGGELLANGTPAKSGATPSVADRPLPRQGHPAPAARRLPGPVPPKSPGRGEPAGSSSPARAFRNLKGFDLRLPLGPAHHGRGPERRRQIHLFRDLLHPPSRLRDQGRKARLTGREFARHRGRLRPAHRPSSPAFRPSCAAPSGFRSVIEVDQAPIGKTPRSTPATYLGIFDLIRQFFASLPEAKIRGYTASRFSFNTAGGRCPTCEGAGRIKLEMAFMPDTYLPCDDCGGSALRAGARRHHLEGQDHRPGAPAHVRGGAVFFDFHSQLSQVCRLMVDCGLGYLTLGQSSRRSPAARPSGSSS
jgi:excinuclease ABC subunit A